MAMIAAAVAIWAYAYVGYPLLLLTASHLRRRMPMRRRILKAASWAHEWPSVSVSLPVHNGAGTIQAAIEAVLLSEYPREKLQVVVISDASDDATDEIVARFAARGVELLRLPKRVGKTAAENAARPYLTGAIIVNTDASVRIHPAAIRNLVRALDDPRVGVASSRDVSVASGTGTSTSAEGAYVAYEMRVREWETQTGGIVGASGCLYAIRAALHGVEIPAGLSRDFCAALTARCHGFIAVSVPEAICFVPRSRALGSEYRRKVRTMARGLRTLWFARALLNPFRYGAFALKLWSHKLVRWIVPCVAFIGLGAAVAETVRAGASNPAVRSWLPVVGLALILVIALLRMLRSATRWYAAGAYLIASAAAGVHAWWVAAFGPPLDRWEPTRRRAA